MLCRSLRCWVRFVTSLARPQCILVLRGGSDLSLDNVWGSFCNSAGWYHFVCHLLTEDVLLTLSSSLMGLKIAIDVCA